tara:strand:- start:2799 stop:3506 length:708 start_codon:yes stop_codon:yes gene_type:complete
MVFGFGWANVSITSFQGDQDAPDLRWVMAWSLVGVVPIMILAMMCPRSELRLITVVWALFAMGLLCVMDLEGLAIFGSTAGWWWWHYVIGGLLAVAPAGIAFLRVRGVVSTRPFVAIAFLGALFAARMAVTEGSDTDRLAHLRRDIRIGMTPAELAGLFDEDDDTDDLADNCDWVRVVDHEVWAPSSDWSGTLGTMEPWGIRWPWGFMDLWGELGYQFDFEDGRLTEVRIAFESD